jgi:hypothetical protein
MPNAATPLAAALVVCMNFRRDSERIGVILPPWPVVQCRAIVWPATVVEHPRLCQRDWALGMQAGERDGIGTAST